MSVSVVEALSDKNRVSHLSQATKPLTGRNDNISIITSSLNDSISNLSGAMGAASATGRTPSLRLLDMTTALLAANQGPTVHGLVE